MNTTPQQREGDVGSYLYIDNFARAVRQTGNIINGLIARAQDWPMADDIAKRMRATLPPKILQLEAMEKQGATPEQIDQFLVQQPEPPPDPKLVKVQQDGQLAIARMQAEMQAEQQAAMAALQLELRRMAEDSKRAQDELMAKLQAMLVDAKTRIEVAQINAGKGKKNGSEI